MLISRLYKPDPIVTLRKFGEMLVRRHPFCFVRFSDGELEILRNRYLCIAEGKTYFRGQLLGNNFPIYDSKEFNPKDHFMLRADLLESALYKVDYFYKGIPTSHNLAVDDRDFMLRLNGGMSEYMTFADLLMNSNYALFREEILPLFYDFNEVIIIANFRARPIGILGNALHVPISDNFFSTYERTRDDVLATILAAPRGALILSSASSLSNIIGYQSFTVRPDLTFLDVGTSLNDLLSLDARTRSYHDAYLSKGWKGLRQKISREYRIRW